MLVSITILYFNTVYGFLLPHGEVSCIFDKTFILTKNLNDFFAKNLNYRNLLIIISSLFIDIVIIAFGLCWSIYGRSWRPILAYFLFYAFRYMTQNLFQMAYPDGYLWEYPGFPSIVVPYLKTNDFFFSGHVGFPLIAAFEFKDFKLNFLFVFCILASCFETITMIVLRGHYIVDLLAGVIFAHYSLLLSDKYKYIFDDSCISMKEEKNEKKENLV